MVSLFARRRTRRSLGMAAVLLGAVGAWVASDDSGETYVPGERTEGLTDSLGRRLPDDHPPLLFTEVAAQAGLVMRHAPFTRSNRLPEDMGSGVALGDVDGDGDVDVFALNTHALGDDAASSAAPDDARCRLFTNRGDGTFDDVTETSGVGLRIMGMGAAFLDRDGDGDLDLFVASYGRCRLLDNDGAGHFRDVSDAAGVPATPAFWSGVAVGDPDGDGDVDVYVCGYVRYDEGLVDPNSTKSQYDSEIPVLINPSAFEPAPNLLLLNRGDGTFVEGAEAAGVANVTGRGLGACFCDLSGDGLVDLYVANDVSDNALFVNLGDGSFADLTARALVGDYRGAMGLAVGDVDGDLDPDLFITHWVAQENALYVNITADLAGEGSGPPVMFMDEADRYGLGQVALQMVGWAASFEDFDSDGLLDLHVVNGSTIPSRGDRTRLVAQRDHLFWNAGTGRGFFELGAVAGAAFAEETVGRGGAAFDLELDGDPDLLVLVRGDGLRLLRNDTPLAGRAALVVRPRQPSGNTQALGARVELQAGGRTQVRWIGSQGSYLSQHAVGEARFGLGAVAEADRLTITWPDGQTESVEHVGSDQLVTWTRGSPPVTEWLPGRVAAWKASANQPPADLEQRRRFHELVGQAADRRIADDPAAAAALYSEALGLWPGHADCVYYVANCLGELGNERHAKRIFELGVQLDPRSSRAWMQLGRLCLPGGDPACDDLAAARLAFARAHAINGEESGPVVQLGVVELLAGDLAAAAVHFADAARTNARDVPSRYYGGYLAWKRGDGAAAERLLAEARAAAAGALGRGHSASAEGDTATGQALVAEGAGSSSHDAIDLWSTLLERGGGDVATEYARLEAALR